MASIKKEDIFNCIKYSKENNIFDKINDIYKSVPNGKCTGCGNCCMESVGISLSEFINIFNFLENDKDLKLQTLDKLINYYFYEYTKKLPCPFKGEDNTCLIYEVRPLNCRIYGHWEKIDYNKNLDSIIRKNIEYKNILKKEYDFDITDEIVNFRIDYCDKFIPDDRYLTKSERLYFSDKLICLDSKIISRGIIDIDFRDRGIVEYFIEYLLDESIAYNIKMKVSKDETLRDRAIKRLKKIILLKI